MTCITIVHVWIAVQNWTCMTCSTKFDIQDKDHIFMACCVKIVLYDVFCNGLLQTVWPGYDRYCLHRFRKDDCVHTASHHVLSGARETHAIHTRRGTVWTHYLSICKLTFITNKNIDCLRSLLFDSELCTVCWTYYLLTRLHIKGIVKKMLICRIIALHLFLSFSDAFMSHNV